MARTFHLEIVTPDRALLSEEVVSIVAPGSEGYLGVLANHAPLVTELGVGVLRIRYPDDTEENVAVSGGFMEVANNRVLVLADSAERPQDIDIQRAREALIRARQMLQDPTADHERARQALEKAINRLRVAGVELTRDLEED
ncbi:MAG: F0F1 ATP synthase subunit epsilon [Armatimonadota bacterium]|nr:F0F1 ATP synthase subunit epsilon [bacterium]MDW8105603.1 F0F1 ATP synthase subunit epsilon [Armatimonadota bacterium]MDW8291327.1 F0F1 ATP synthase subunit epsilon [Armatimonadota bacterium]